LLTATLLLPLPIGVPGEVRIIALGGAWLSLVLAMTLPSERESAGRELVHRLAQFRHEMNAVGNNPSRASLEALIDRVKALGLREDEVREELTQVRASIAALDVHERLSRGELPFVDASESLFPGDPCHFVCPVRFGRRRADQVGHLVMAPAWLQFRGAVDMRIAWSEIATVSRNGAEILVGLHESKRVLRFACNSPEAAARGGVIAEHLARIARGDSSSAPIYHASA
jgi:hypothetical protein